MTLKLDKLIFVAEQEGNSLGTTGPHEYLNIHLETQLPGEPPFWVIATEGWSFDNIGELVRTLKEVAEKLKAVTNDDYDE